MMEDRLEDLNRALQAAIDAAPTIGDEIEIRQRCWEAYVSCVPAAVEIAEGATPRTVVDRAGKVVEVLPSYCERIAAFNVIAQRGLGLGDSEREREILVDLRSRLEMEVQEHLGLTLEETWRQCPQAGLGG